MAVVAIRAAVLVLRPMATRKLQQRTLDTRAGIMAAAYELFAQKGYAATGVRDVAEKAGCNQALVSYHFGGKSKLYDAVLEDSMTSFVEAVTGYGDESSDDPLNALILGFAEAFTVREHFVAIILREYLNPDRMLNVEAAANMRRSMALTEKMIKALPATARAREFDPQLVHLMIVSPMLLFIVARPVRETVAKVDPTVSAPDLRDYAEQMARMLAPALE